MQFRQKALSTLQSPEELDLPVRFARPQGRLVLAVTVLVMAAAAYWTFTGTVTSKLSAPGILTHTQGRYLLQSPLAGQVTEVLVTEGSVVSAGQPLVVVRTGRGEAQVRALAAGRLTALYARTGTVVSTGTDVATVERTTGPHEPLVAVLYVPGSDTSKLRKGARVDLTVASAARDTYGVLRGKVTAVGRAPQTKAQIGGFLGDDQLAAAFTRQGNPIAVLVTLDRSPDTASGYAWSSADGPPYAVESGTPVSGSVHLSSQRPVDWLLP
ncbi:MULTISPECIES: HlyD family efflux transporter periplasmic adaptor subunit [unclassified Streptomyces]|uniref:HlyD family efflux transporter periplasmic adaptor subunit n=1 Tax=unclassified Streptomyces TaxID=2593676 RepID=UPI002E338B2D|nr:HlyD family efflux transporter periplasmic adaptor subunit [Streptomyces sp. NBC_01268]